MTLTEMVNMATKFKKIDPETFRKWYWSNIIKLAKEQGIDVGILETTEDE